MLGGLVRVWARSTLIALLVVAGISGSAPSAFAWNETTTTAPTDINEANCGGCHQTYPSGFGSPAVHGNYTTTTRKCAACHSTHDAPSSFMLLPGPTVQATCMTCHDGTQGKGVYGAIAARGLAVGATHRNETTNVVPGGDPSTGGPATMSFGGSGGTLSCDDCHSPHGSSLVATFTPERKEGSIVRPWATNLLKRRPGNSASETAVYGSDWCGACHRGRLSGSGMANNHPVDSKVSTATPFFFEQAAILSTDAPTSSTTTGTLARTNRGYMMPFPRTSQQQGHSPICQQCHEDSRNVGTLDPSGAPADAAPFTITLMDGAAPTDNPRFQNFPHESVNMRFLVEPGNDLCLNCHPLTILP